MAAFACRNFLLFSGLKNKKIPASKQCDSYTRANESTQRCKDDKKIAFLEGWKWTQTTNLIYRFPSSQYCHGTTISSNKYKCFFLLRETVGKKFNIFNHLPSVYLALIQTTKQI